VTWGGTNDLWRSINAAASGGSATTVVKATSSTRNGERMKLEITFNALKTVFYVATLVIEVPEGTKPDDLDDELLADLRDNYIGDDEWELSSSDWDDPGNAPPPYIEPVTATKEPNAKLIRDEDGTLVFSCEEDE
jgi:hypothetical protein